MLVLGLVMYPLSMLATEVALRRIDGRLEEAALMVAAPTRVFWRITVPLAAPSIVAAGLVTFVLAVSEFGVPGVLRVRVYTTEIFTAFAALYDPGRATLLALPLLALCLGVAVVAVSLHRRPLLGSVQRGGHAGRPATRPLARRRRGRRCRPAHGAGGAARRTRARGAGQSVGRRRDRRVG